MQVTSQHDHEQDTEVINREEAIQELRTQVEADPSRPIRRVYNNVADDREEREDDTPVFDSVRSVMGRCRNRHLPPIPQNIQEVNVEGQWAQTWRGHNFLSLQDNALGILVFVTIPFLHILCEVETIFIDGTFKTAPRPYQQLVTIHGRYLGNVF